MTTRSSRPTRGMLLLLLPLALVVACGDEEEEGLYTRAQAEQTARAFVEACGRGEASTALRSCALPFRFGTRLWTEQKQLEENLAFQVARLRTEAARFDRFEVFSWRDLMNGRWPRGRTVPEEGRENAIRKLGVGRDGFVVRAFRENVRGWRIVINPDVATDALKVTALIP